MNALGICASMQVERHKKSRRLSTPDCDGTHSKHCVSAALPSSDVPMASSAHPGTILADGSLSVVWPTRVPAPASP